MKKYFIVIGLIFSVVFSKAQIEGFEKLGKLQYKIIHSNTEDDSVQFNKYVKIAYKSTYNDSLLTPDIFPTNVLIDSSAIPADYLKIILQCKIGDSVIVATSTDSIEQYSKPKFILPNTFLYTHLKFVEIFKDKEASDKDAEIELVKYDSLINVVKKQRTALEQKDIDAYLFKHNIKAYKTLSGLNFSVIGKGKGSAIKKGDKVKINYIGKTLKGKVFDSNLLVRFNHTEPLEFTVGENRLIKGLEEAVRYFNRGGKGILLIPSALGYWSKPVGDIVGEYEILVFEIRIL